jgi:hypothetical protein
MMRRLNLLALTAVTLALCGTGVAVGDSSPGVLSSAEYQQLTSIQGQYSAKSLKSLPGLEAAMRACDRVSPISALVGAERSDCRAGFGWLVSSVQVVSKLRSCEHASSVDSRLSCLLPGYRKLSTAVQTYYRADVKVNDAAAARHFTKTCVEALGDTPTAIAAEGRMARDASKLVSAIQNRNVSGVQEWGNRYDSDTADAESSGSKLQISVCPHQ